MKTFVQPGDALTLTAPATVSAGALVQVGTNIIGVAATDAASAAPVVVETRGVFTMPAAVTNTAAVAGQRAYYDATNNAISVTATTGYIHVGVFTKDKTTADATVTVRLNGVF